MGLTKSIWDNPAEYIRQNTVDRPVLFFCPEVLQATARRFCAGFPGLVTYAVKSNPDEMVLSNLAAAGLRGFDVASPHEMDLVRGTAPNAVMHYNNPVRSHEEIAFAQRAGVRSFSVDSRSELDKLARHLTPGETEVSVRFKLPVAGAAYDFGTKFGAAPEQAADLLKRAEAAGFVPSLTFHPGTQCTSPQAWVEYIRAAAGIERAAGVRIARLNVGGGFPSHRQRDAAPDLEALFRAIDAATAAAFGNDRPALVCEPGRGMVAECFSLATRVKAIRDDEHVFLNDGVYGGLAEMPLLGNVDRVDVLTAAGRPRGGAPAERTIFGPTCDSIDRLPGVLPLPADTQEGDYVVFQGMGAYSTATVTRFNGYGAIDVVTVRSLGS